MLEMHSKIMKPLPKVYKHLDGNDYELEVFHNCPKLRNHIINIEDGDCFSISEADVG